MTSFYRQTACKIFFVLAAGSYAIFLEPLQRNTPALNILFYVFFFFYEKILNLICSTEKESAWRVRAFFFFDFLSLPHALFSQLPVCLYSPGFTGTRRTSRDPCMGTSLLVKAVECRDHSAPIQLHQELGEQFCRPTGKARLQCCTLARFHFWSLSLGFC